MSDEGETLTSFNCYFGGTFDRLDDLEYYVGGEYKLIESVAEQLFGALTNDLPVRLYGQRVWYKLPFEGVEDRKFLQNGDPQFVKMCDAAMWTKTIDIYLDPDEEEADEEARVERHVDKLKTTSSQLILTKQCHVVVHAVTNFVDESTVASI